MRIAIQASDLDHARIDGTRVYIKELLKRFGTLDSETQFLLYHRGNFNTALAPPSFPNYRVKSLPFPTAWMQTRFAWEIHREKPEKLFLPIQAAPFWLSGTEVTVTIHDLAFKKYPETFPSDALWKLSTLLEVALKKASKIIAVSQSTKADLLTHFPYLPENKIRVIHHGFDRDFYGARVDQNTLQTTLSNAGLSAKSYTLYVGALQPRKNLMRVMDAFERVKKNNPEMKLVLAGEPAWLSQSILDRAAMSVYAKDIVFTGRLSFEELRILYQGARMFIFPSLYEGFGLPVLEAMASGTPVLTAHNSSLPEVAGEGALYCDAEKMEDIADRWEKFWSDEALRADLIQKGQSQITKFSWDACAQETLEYIKT